MLLGVLAVAAGCTGMTPNPQPVSNQGPDAPPATVAQPGTTVLASSPSDQVLRQGDRVRCRWKNGPTEYAGQVAEVRGEQVFIQYDDGDQELTSPSLCRKDAGTGGSVADFAVGTRVRCQWKGRPTEYPGRVAAIEGDRLFIHYDDGDEERILPSLCRVEGTAAAVATDAQLFDIASSSNPGGGSAYQGQVAIRKNGDVFDLRWSINNAPAYSGIGIREGNILGVGWGVGDNFGVVVYRVQGGSLRGRWASAGTQGQIGTEDLQGPAGLRGTYNIVASHSPIGGKSYTGTVTIQPTGETYTLQWNLPRESYGGVGIKRGDLLVVGWGAGKGAGVVAYTGKGDDFDGVWATPGGTQLGTEVLRHNSP